MSETSQVNEAALRKPTPDEVRVQTEQFMELLKDLKADASPEAQNIRAALVDTVTSYREGGDEQARQELLTRMLGLEAGAAELLLKTIAQLQRRLYKEGKRIGTASQAGKSIRAMSKALDAFAEGLQEMVDAISEGNQQLRESAHKKLDDAKKLLKTVGLRG